MKEFYPRKGDVERLNNENFDEKVFAGEQEMTIIVFYAKFCKQCKFHAPSLRAAGRRYKNDPKVKVFAVNQEGNYELSARFDLEPAQETIMYSIGKPQTDGDLKLYDGDVSFAAMLQFIGSQGKEKMKTEKYVPTLYKDYGPSKWVRRDLTWDNFNETVFDSTKNVLLQFYAGWSEFCQIDAKNYTVLAARMRKEHPDVVIAAIDVDKHEDLADRFDITGLPAYWFANKTVTKDTQLLKYTGDHSGSLVMEELFPFINSQGQIIPDGMKYDKPIHPEPWEVISAKLEKQKKENQELAEKTKKKQEEDAVAMRAKLEAKKKAMQDKKNKKKKNDEL